MRAPPRSRALQPVPPKGGVETARMFGQKFFGSLPGIEAFGSFVITIDSGFGIGGFGPSAVEGMAKRPGLARGGGAETAWNGITAGGAAELWRARDVSPPEVKSSIMR